MTIYEREGKERGTQGGREEGVTMGREREDCLTQSANPAMIVTEFSICNEIQNPKYCSFRCNMNGTETNWNCHTLLAVILFMLHLP